MATTCSIASAAAWTTAPALSSAAPRANPRSALSTFDLQLANVQTIKGVTVLAVEVTDADADTLRALADKFREKYPNKAAAVLRATVPEAPETVR